MTQWVPLRPSLLPPFQREALGSTDRGRREAWRSDLKEGSHFFRCKASVTGLQTGDGVLAIYAPEDRSAQVASTALISDNSASEFRPVLLDSLKGC